MNHPLRLPCLVAALILSGCAATGAAPPQANTDAPMPAKQAPQETFEQAVRQDPSYNNLIGYSVDLINAGRSAEAVSACDRALNLKPNDPIALNNKATALLQIWEVGQAEKNLNLALKAAPSFALAKGNLAWAARSRNALETTIATLKKELPKASGDDRKAKLFRLATAQYQLAQYNESNRTYARLVKSDARNARAHNNIGINLMALEKYDAAATSFKRAVDLDPKTPLYANNLKWATDMQKAAAPKT